MQRFSTLGLLLILSLLGVAQPHRVVRLGYRGGGPCARPSITCRSGIAAVRLSAEGDSEDSEGESANIDAFRAQLLRQFGGSGGDDDAAPAASQPAAPAEEEIPLCETSTLSSGVMLIANPEKFCSRNPFARPVKELGRFGLQGPIDLGDVSPDDAAQMLPVLMVLEHSEQGSKAVLLERRTGALMGDISMDDFGCVAISPLWLGGKANSNNLYVLHTYDGIPGATQVCDGLWLGGWADAQPKVADSTLAEGRFKFFLGATAWEGNQLQQEVDAGAWVVLESSPESVIKDRILNMRPGKPKPVWTELMQSLGDARKAMLEMVYPPEA